MAPKIPDIPEEELTPDTIQLLEVLRYQSELIQQLRDEIAILKGNKPRPDIKPSGMDKNTGRGGKSSKSRRPGSAKKNKTSKLEIHKSFDIPARDVPEGSIFKGYKEFVVQNIVIKPENIKFRMERWRTPSGSYVNGELPEWVKGHFAPSLVSFIQYQYHQCHVTQPLLWEQLKEIGFDISSGQINRILTEGNDHFHAEKDDILETGLEISSYVQVDDTGARHAGQNGYCTHIGNELFAWFQSTQSKSRLNFLELLRAGHKDYALTPESIEYMRSRRLAELKLCLLEENVNQTFSDKQDWLRLLEKYQFKSTRHIQIATEGSILGSILSHGINRELVILSDDAGQFNILLHALCWIHAERTINKLIPVAEKQRADLETIRDQIWVFYADLKKFKEQPDAERAVELESRFDDIFTTRTCFEMLNQALRNLCKNKNELLMVLNRPEIPLHNNASETDIREYVKRRKISGGTRSVLGRQSRDSFISLKKTCRKLGQSFWEYLNDRNSGSNTIPTLASLMRHRAVTSSF